MNEEPKIPLSQEGVGMVRAPTSESAKSRKARLFADASDHATKARERLQLAQMCWNDAEEVLRRELKNHAIAEHAEEEARSTLLQSM